MKPAGRFGVGSVGRLASGTLLLSVLAACSTESSRSEEDATLPAPAVQPDEVTSDVSVSWKGRGQEPFWTLQVNGLDTEFRQPGAGYERTADEVVMETETDGRTIAKFIGNDVPYLIVTRVDGLCLDGATGVPLPYTLEVQSGEQTLSGCGGTTEEYLAEGTWVVEDLDGKGVVDGGEPRISFGIDGSLAINSICREIAGSYTVNGPELVFEFEPVDDQGCAVPALNNQEGQILDALSFPLQMSAETGGGLELQSDHGHRMLLRR